MSDKITEQQIDMESKSIKATGMTRYELCWDLLWDKMCSKSHTILDGGWPLIVLNMMTDIENEVIGPNNASE